MNAREEFDYKIVGAGSAGCVLAARLSQDPNVRVALLEAGGQDDAPEIDMPVAFPQLFKTKYDWDFATEPEQGLGERRIYLPRGRMLAMRNFQRSLAGHRPRENLHRPKSL
jgi:choline dehydrogenase